MWQKIVAFLARKQGAAIVLWGVNALVACLSSFGIGARPATTAAVTAAVSAVITIISAVAIRPLSVPVVTGAAVTLAQVAAAAGWIHATSAQIGTSVTVLSVLLALLTHQEVRIRVLRRALAAARPPAPAG